MARMFAGICSPEEFDEMGFWASQHLDRGADRNAPG